MRRVGRLLATTFVRLRLLVIVAWVGVVVWAVAVLPPLHSTAAGSLRDLVPKGSPAVAAEQVSGRRFSFPLLSRTIVVVSNPHGLSAARQADLVDVARRLAVGRIPALRVIAGALPLSNSVSFRPFAIRPGTTMLLYLLFRPSVATGARTAAAHQLVKQVIGHRSGEYEGVTGEVPAEVAQEALITSRLKWVELATLALVAFAVGVYFRAVGPPLVALGVVASAYLISERMVQQIAQYAHVAVPSQAQPILVVLVFGVATDYSIFFLSRFRLLLRQGVPRLEAAAQVVRQITPIVFTAGITVAAGTAALLVADVAFIRGFGPALAVAVLVAMLVAVVAVPAVLATLGRHLYWPAPISRGRPETPARSPGAPRFAAAALASRHPIMAVMVAAVVIFGAASGLVRTAVGNELVQGLPTHSAVRHTYEVARRGFPSGILAPAVVVVTGRGIGAGGTAVTRVEHELAGQPGVAQVLGPGQRPPLGFGRLSVWLAPGAARYVVFFASDPLGARAIAHARALQQRMPGLLRTAGIGSARGQVAGDTALSADIVHSTLTSLARVIPTMLVAIFVVIAIFLRALVAPLYLVLTSVLATAAALGLTTYVAQDLLGYGALTYYVVFTVAVMLISLGSDYNVFLVGRIWQEGRRRTLSDAVAIGGTRASRPIATAALILACSFALVLIVPLQSFWEIGLAMAVGLLIDAFVVRSVLVPAILVLLGPRSAWPGRALRARSRRGAAGSYSPRRP